MFTVISIRVTADLRLKRQVIMTIQTNLDRTVVKGVGVTPLRHDSGLKCIIGIEISRSQ